MRPCECGNVILTPRKADHELSGRFLRARLTVLQRPWGGN